MVRSRGRGDPDRVVVVIVELLTFVAFDEGALFIA